MGKDCASDSGYIGGVKVYRDLYDVWHKVGAPGAERIEKVSDFRQFARDVASGRAGRVLVQAAGSPKPKSYAFSGSGPGYFTASAHEFAQGRNGRRQEEEVRRRRLATGVAGKFEVPPPGHNRARKLGETSTMTRFLRDNGVYNVSRSKDGRQLVFGLTGHAAAAKVSPPLVGKLDSRGEPTVLFAAQPRRVGRLDKPLARPHRRQRRSDSVDTADAPLDGGSVRIHLSARRAARAAAGAGIGSIADRALPLRAIEPVVKAAVATAQLALSERSEVYGDLGITYNTGTLNEGDVLGVFPRTRVIATMTAGQEARQVRPEQLANLSAATAEMWREIERELGNLRRSGAISAEVRDRASARAKGLAAELITDTLDCLQAGRSLPETVRLLECDLGPIAVARKAVTDALGHVGGAK